MNDRELLNKIMFDKEVSRHWVPKILVENVKQTLQEYIAEETYDYLNRYQKTKSNLKIQCYIDCIALLDELLKEPKT